jgi:hypothetical protein
MLDDLTPAALVAFFELYSPDRHQVIRQPYEQRQTS